MEFFSLFPRSWFLPCTLINRRYQAGLWVMKVLQLLTWSPFLSVPAAGAQGSLTDNIYSCWDTWAGRKGLNWALLQLCLLCREERRDRFISTSGLSRQELMDRSGFFSHVGRGCGSAILSFMSPICCLSFLHKAPSCCPRNPGVRLFPEQRQHWDQPLLRSVVHVNQGHWRMTQMDLKGLFPDLCHAGAQCEVLGTGTGRLLPGQRCGSCVEFAMVEWVTPRRFVYFPSKSIWH